MQINPESFGDILKSARQNADITIEALAERVGVTERYIYRLENEGKKPSYEVLYKLIHALSISADSFFYPEKPAMSSEKDEISRMLYECDERSMTIIKATVRAAIDSQSEKLS